MPIDIRQIAVTPEGRLAQRLADLERRNAMLERGNLNQIVRNRQYAEAISEVSTTLTTPVDLGGPSISVSVPAGAFVAVYAEVSMHTGGAGQAAVWLYEPTDLPRSQQILLTGSTVYEVLRTMPGSVIGGTANGGQIIFVPTAGERTYSLRYSMTGGTAGFQHPQALDRGVLAVLGSGEAARARYAWRKSESPFSLARAVSTCRNAGAGERFGSDGVGVSGIGRRPARLTRGHRMGRVIKVGPARRHPPGPWPIGGLAP